MNPNSPIRDIMTSDLITVHPEDTVEQIKSIFEKESFHHLPVIEQDQNLMGIITKEDLLKVYQLLSLNTPGKTWTQKECARLTAKDIMTEFTMDLEPDDSIGLAADIFLANKFAFLPYECNGVG